MLNLPRIFFISIVNLTGIKHSSIDTLVIAIANVTLLKMMIPF